MEKNPCYKCKKRNPDCHCKCEDYKNWKQEHDELRDKMRQEKVLSFWQSDYVMKYNIKMAKKNRNFKFYSSY